MNDHDNHDMIPAIIVSVLALAAVTIAAGILAALGGAA